MVTALQSRGWTRFGWDCRTARWAEAAYAAGRKALQDPKLEHWYQCEKTWFVGVDALPNDATGALGDIPLGGAAIDAITAGLGPIPTLHRAQLSVMFPGYPKPRAGEGEGAYRYRLKRDSAHVDGLLAEGPDRRRHLREPHAWILGLPAHHIACRCRTACCVGAQSSHHGRDLCQGLFRNADRGVGAMWMSQTYIKRPVAGCLRTANAFRCMPNPVRLMSSTDWHCTVLRLGRRQTLQDA